MATNQYGQTEWDADPETAAELRRLSQQEKIAAAMMKQGQQPLTGGMVGNTYVGASPLQGLANMFHQYNAGQATKNAEEGYKALGDRKAQEYASAIADYKRNTMGTPGTPEQALFTDDYTAVPKEDQVKAAVPATVPTADQRRQAIIEAAVSTNPRLSKMGQMDFQMDARKEDKAAAREDRLFQIDMAHQNNLEAIKQRAVEQRLSQQQLREQIDAANERNARLVASLRQPRDEGAPVAVTGPDGKPIYVSKKDAIGKTPAAMDAKAQAIAQRQADGSTDVDVALGTLRDAYNRLESGGGITSTGKGAMDNAGASLYSSGIGQGVGKIFGTKNQSARNDVAMARPALLAALMKATGMSSKQMDSNAELKLWLSTATDPTLDVESNRKALDNIEKKYLKSGVAKPASAGGSSGEWKDL